MILMLYYSVYFCCNYKIKCLVIILILPNLDNGVNKRPAVSAMRTVLAGKVKKYENEDKLVDRRQ